MSAVNKLVRAWREGTLVEKLASKLGRMPVTQRVRWLGARDQSDAIAALTQWGKARQREAGGWLLLLGDDDALDTNVDQFTGFVWDDGGRDFLRDTAACMRCWLETINTIAGADA